MKTLFINLLSSLMFLSAAVDLSRHFAKFNKNETADLYFKNRLILKNG